MPELVTKHISHGPHIQFSDSILFITWRLAFTLPAPIMKLFKELSSNNEETKALKEELKYDNPYIYKKFWEYDDALGKLPAPGLSLNNAEIAKIIRDTLHFYTGRLYVLIAFCLMSNHVHLVLQALPKETGGNYKVNEIVQSIKKYTSKKIKEVTGDASQVWDNYYFDRVIRDEKNYHNVLSYVLNNPVKAGLVERPDQWRDSYLNEEIYHEG